MKKETILKGSDIIGTINKLNHELEFVKISTFYCCYYNVGYKAIGRNSECMTFADEIAEAMEDVKDKLIRKYEKLIKIKEKELEGLKDE